MGITLESKTIDREKRYTSFSINKQADGNNTAQLVVSTGYYDDFNNAKRWVSEYTETITLNSDQLTILMGLKHGELGLTASGLNLFKFLDTAIYAIVSKELLLTYILDVEVKNTKGEPLSDYAISIVKNGQYQNSLYVITGGESILRGEALLGAVLNVAKHGYKTQEVTFDVLRGELSKTITLEEDTPVIEPAPAVTVNPNDDIPTEPVTETVEE